jgi:hypothetical protein
MNPPTPEQFREAFSRVGRERLAVHNFAGLEIQARAELAELKAEHIREGLDGSNQAQRDALLDSLLKPERMHLANCQEELREAQVLHEMAVLAVESLKWQLRAHEATTRLEGVLEAQSRVAGEVVV